MKSKMKFLIKQSLTKKIKTKWFMAANIILFVLLIGVANIDKIIKYFGGDFEAENKIIVVTDTVMGDNFKAYFDMINEQAGNLSKYTVEINNENIIELKETLEEDNNIIIEINESVDEYLTSEITSFDPIDTITFQLINATLNSVKSEYALANSDIDREELARVMQPMSISSVTTNPDLEEDAAAKDILATGIMIIFILPFFILIIMLVQMLGAEINDEKTTRSMEIIISNVSPRTHFAAKIIAATTFVLFQAVLLFVYGGIGFLVRSLMGGSSLVEGSAIGDAITQVMDLLKNTGIMASLLQAIPIIILLLIINLLAYALLAGILASMTASFEDFQQLQTPLMIICLVGYYLAIMASFFEGAAFIKVFSYLPFFSAIIAPVIYLLGQTTLLELLLSVGIVSGTCFLLFRYGLRVYKVGILNYSSKDLWKKVFKAIKETN